MYESADLILVGVLAAVFGLAIGAGLHRALSASAGRTRDLQRKLDQEREQAEQYKAHVTQHYSQTAGLLTELTLKYKDIHDHLAQGADQLCRDAQGNSLLPNVPAELRIEEKEVAESSETKEAPPTPPLDYAPKDAESEAGQLSEEFGLEKVKLSEDIVANPVPGAFAASENFAEGYQQGAQPAPAGKTGS